MHSRWDRSLATMCAGVLVAAAGCGDGRPGDDLADVSSFRLPGAPSGFRLTPPGTNLTFGQTAHVVTRAADGPTQYWAVTQGRPTDLPAPAGDAASDIERYVCFVYGLTFLGAGTDGAPSAPVTQPAGFAGLGDDGRTGTIVFDGRGRPTGASVCGAHPTLADAKITALSGLVAGREFQGALRSFVTKDRGEGKGIDPKRLSYTYYAGNLLGIPADKKIVWS